MSPLHPDLVPVDAFAYAASLFADTREYSNDPHGWVQEHLGEFIWSKQQEVLDSLKAERYTAVPSCHDAGKSFIAARAAAWWIASHPPGEAFVVSTAPTSAQVSAILWREIRKAHKKGNLIGNITSAGYPIWKIEGEEVGYGRKPADYSTAAFQGIHARFVLVILDEASGVDKTLYDAVDALATNEYARVLAIGNPDDATSHFAEVCKPDSGWNVVHIDGLRTPNFTRERVLAVDCGQCRRIGRERPLLADLYEVERIPYSEEVIPDAVRPMLLSPLWVEERLHRWVGRAEDPKSLAVQAANSSLFTAKVRGMFPSSSTEGVIPLGWVERAMARYRDWVSAGRPDLPGRTILGVDVARGGADETCVATRTGMAIWRLDKYPQADTMETTAYVQAKLNAYRGELAWTARAIVDTIGVGAGVYDRLRESNSPAEPFTASQSGSHITDRSGEFSFTTLRSAAWWNLRELLDPSRRNDVLLVDDEILKADLTAPRWRVLSGQQAKIQVEVKDEVRKRLGRSTDSGDAVVMAFFDEIGAMDAPGEPRAVDWYEQSEQHLMTPERWVDDRDGWAINPEVGLGWDGLGKWLQE